VVISERTDIVMALEYRWRLRRALRARIFIWNGLTEGKESSKEIPIRRMKLVITCEPLPVDLSCFVT
jgi:hypothetical protein